MKNNNNARTEGLTDEVCWHSKHLKLNLNGTNVNVDASHIHTHTQAPVKLTGMVPINSQNHIISVMCLLLACVVVKVMQWGGGGGGLTIHPLGVKIILILQRVVFSPAGFKAFELLDEEVLQNFGTLVEGWVAGVVVAAVVEDFGHVCYKLSQLDVLAPL